MDTRNLRGALWASCEGMKSNGKRIRLMGLRAVGHRNLHSLGEIHRRIYYLRLVLYSSGATSPLRSLDRPRADRGPGAARASASACPHNNFINITPGGLSRAAPALVYLLGGEKK
ncbi:hypothetical protein EVAR_51310_1 [Eumeta japonica]|uniref:Uncharacterized protein n=1 Tax=Eumeta variegata TaxID=151549 RepID=A0A4C1XQK3_EUMVA|nr:hypothetical protein EVAR_51310_1 [Eumeta japonica]